MPDIPTLRRLRAKRPPRQDHQPRTLIDMVLDQPPAEDGTVQVSVVTITAFGFRAQAHGQTGFAALRHMRREHPVLVRFLYTYVTAMSALTAAVAVRALL
ncbi:hypothetical protein [Streptomyces sp. bgisy153]|uniref:hypothetical protein n=1 Tax=Streptomyces sp. bgisy153 TaxID=3413793 RepID=UPI003D70D06C